MPALVELLAFCASAWDVYAVALIVLRGGSEVPNIYTVGGPDAAVVRCLMYYDLRAWRCKWCAVETKGTVELGFCWQSWIET